MSLRSVLRSEDFVDQSFVSLTDGQSIFSGIPRLSQSFGSKGLNYNHLRQVIDDQRETAGLGRSQIHVASFSCDPTSSTQQRFQTAVSHAGFKVDPVDYRIATVTTNPEPIETNAIPQRIQSLAPRLSNLIGRLSHRDNLRLLVVSNCFELFDSLNELAERPNTQVGLAFFSTLLDDRWRRVGLATAGCSIKFIQLDDYIEFLFQQPIRSPIVFTQFDSNNMEVRGLSKY